MAQLLSKQDFIDKVHDFQQGGDWSFKGERPCIIDFYADWCMPCKMIAPIVEELSKEYEGQIDIYKVDTEEEHELSAYFNIQGIPSILFIPKEGEPQMKTGHMPKEGFVEAIRSVLGVE